MERRTDNVALNKGDNGVENRRSVIFGKSLYEPNCTPSAIQQCLILKDNIVSINPIETNPNKRSVF